MKLRVWHIPQVPGQPFYVDVNSPEEDDMAVKDCFMYNRDNMGS